MTRISANDIVDPLTDAVAALSVSDDQLDNLNNGTRIRQGRPVLHPPPAVSDGSGDPHGIYYLDPPPFGAVGQRWVVWMGLNPGIYDNWPLAQAQVDGISFSSYQGFGNPRVAWQAYEARRLQNLVHRLPYISSVSPPITPQPRSRSHHYPMSAPASRHSSRTTRLSGDLPHSPHSSSLPYNPVPRSSTQSVVSLSSGSKGPEVPQDPHFQPALPSLRPRVMRERKIVQLSECHQESPSDSHTVRPVRDQQQRPASPSNSRAIRPDRDATAAAVNLSSHSVLTAHPASHTSQASPRVSVIYTKVTSRGYADFSLPMRRLTSEDDPWNDEAEGYVVFKGSVPGVYRTWEDCKNLTRDCLGPVYRGYQTWSEAVVAYREAVDAGITEALPLIFLGDSESHTLF